MYHSLPNLNITRKLVLIWCLLTLTLANSPVLAEETVAAAELAGITDVAALPSGAGKPHVGRAMSSSFEVLSRKRPSRSRPIGATIYEYDKKPLGDRVPFLLVHGLHGEFYPYFRWDKVAKHFNADPEFANRFKVYFMRYDSRAELAKTVPAARDSLDDLYQASHERPICVMALSMGGNLTYEAMLNEKTDKQVALLMTLGTPFRGSPLFSSDWLQYGIYKNPETPWMRIDHALAYRIYFDHNPNLLSDLTWDDSDHAIPNIGPFSSKWPLGPHGDLTVADTINRRLLGLNSHVVDRKKIITYGGYLINPYLMPGAARFIETKIMAPYTLFTVLLPAHLAREHPVLKMLNRTIATVIATPEAVSRAETPFVYALNDGITPLSSALFLPANVLASQAISKESDVPKLKNAIDVRIARVFRNIDHLSFIDGYNPRIIPTALRDELSPESGHRRLFSWMLNDIKTSFEETSTVAKNNLPDSSVRE
jgi:hypothetical protein